MENVDGRSVTNFLAYVSPFDIVNKSSCGDLRFHPLAAHDFALTCREKKIEEQFVAFNRFVSIQFGQLDCSVKSGKNTIMFLIKTNRFIYCYGCSAAPYQFSFYFSLTI